MNCLKFNFESLCKYIFFFTLGLLALIDSVNGFLILNYNISVTIIYRIIVMLMLIIYIYIYNKKNTYIYTTLFFTYLISIGFYNIIIYQDIDRYQNMISAIYNEISQLSKLIFIIVLIESCKNFIKNNKLTFNTIEKIVNLNIILFPIVLIIPMILGIGFDVYSGGIGNKGFFNANNELGIVLSTLYIFALDNIYNKVNLKNIIKLVLLIISMISISSKVAIITPIIITIIYYIKSIFKMNCKLKFITILNIITMYAIYLVNGPMKESINGFINRQVYVTNQISNSILDAIFSGRIKFLESIYYYTSENLSIFENIFGCVFGLGINTKENMIGSIVYGYGRKTIELDGLDAIFSYGIIGFIIIYGYFIYNYIKYYNKDVITFKYRLAFLVILILGFFTGHVFWTAMGGSILAITMSGMISYSEKEKL